MSTDRDTTRVVRSWLKVDAHESADRVLDAVLDALPATPQRRASWFARRFPPMNMTARVAVAAAAIVAVAIVGLSMISRGPTGPGTALSPSPSPTVTPSAPTSLSDVDPAVPLPAGTYLIDDLPVAGVTLELPDGWQVTQSGARYELRKVRGANNTAFVTLQQVGAIYTDPCGSDELTTKPDAAGVAAVLADQPGFVVEGTGATRLGGRPGWHLQIYNEIAMSTCVDDTWLYQWTYLDRGQYVRAATIPYSSQDIYLLDMPRGVLLTQAWTFDNSPPADVAEALAIVESMAITPT